MSITLTDNALNHVQKWLKKRGAGIGLRIGVKTRGCSGLAYVIDIVDADAIQEDDYIFDQEDGLKVYVPLKAYPFIAGLKVDYVKHGLKEGFEYENPNEKGACGCGESFNV